MPSKLSRRQLKEQETDISDDIKLLLERQLDGRMASLLGFAQRSGQLASGAEGVGAALRKGKAECLIIAYDCPKHARNIQPWPPDVVSRVIDTVPKLAGQAISKALGQYSLFLILVCACDSVRSGQVGFNLGEKLGVMRVKKVRVYELAKELDLESKSLVDFLLELGADVKNHMSSVEPDIADMVREHFLGTASPVGKSQIDGIPDAADVDEVVDVRKTKSLSRSWAKKRKKQSKHGDDPEIEDKRSTGLPRTPKARRKGLRPMNNKQLTQASNY